MRDASINLRVPKETKVKLQAAAEDAGLSLTEFLINAAAARAAADNANRHRRAIAKRKKTVEKLLAQFQEDLLKSL